MQVFLVVNEGRRATVLIRTMRSHLTKMAVYQDLCRELVETYPVLPPGWGSFSLDSFRLLNVRVYETETEERNHLTRIDIREDEDFQQLFEQYGMLQDLAENNYR